MQANLSLQAAEADATATSGDVTVEQTSELTAGLDGITAESNAVASAELDQSATQTNEDDKDIARAEGSTDGGVSFQPLTIDVQLAAVLQANASLQFGAADAEATSGEVDVTTLDKLTAGGDGIIAESNAVASADVDQSADQENTNDMSADGVGVLQVQLGGQLNLNVQAASSDADATSGDVDVEQDGVLHSGGDGITAESNAVASATLEQSADQDNETSATATLDTTGVLLPIGSNRATQDRP